MSIKHQSEAKSMITGAGERTEVGKNFKKSRDNNPQNDNHQSRRHNGHSSLRHSKVQVLDSWQCTFSSHSST